MDPVKAAIIYYSSTGTVHALAQAVAEGAEKSGAQVRLRKVPELAPASAIESNPTWAEYVRESSEVTEARLDDLAWAEVVISGPPSPTRRSPRRAATRTARRHSGRRARPARP